MNKLWKLSGILLVAACSSAPDGGDATMDADSKTQALQSKPSFEAAQSQYRDAVAQMADKLAALTPGTTWTLEEDSWVGCSGDLTDTSGRQVYQMAVFSGPIADGVWPTAVQIVTDGAAALGAGEVGVFRDKPGDHDIYVAGPDGVEFRLGTQKSSTLTARSDCRLSTPA